MRNIEWVLKFLFVQDKLIDPIQSSNAQNCYKFLKKKIGQRSNEDVHET